MSAKKLSELIDFSEKSSMPIDLNAPLPTPTHVPKHRLHTRIFDIEFLSNIISFCIGLSIMTLVILSHKHLIMLNMFKPSY